MIIAALLPCNIFAKETVNILTWYGYLDLPGEAAVVEQRCNVNLSYDEFYSNVEFINRFSKNRKNYDIIIFSDTVYNQIAKDIDLPNSTLYKVSSNYNSVVKAHYLNNHFNNNVSYFMLSLTGFLWNPQVSNFKENESVFNFFQQAGNNIVVMIDDPTEAQVLLTWALNSRVSEINDNINTSLDMVPLTSGNFKKLYQNSQFYIVNDLSAQLFDQPKFAFAYAWSGNAIAALQNHPKLKFAIDPKLSYVTTDLIAQLNEKAGTTCVANYLASPEFLKYLQNQTYYFSPYLPKPSGNNPVFVSVYQQLMARLAEIPWIIPPSAAELKKISAQWEQIKINLKLMNQNG